MIIIHLITDEKFINQMIYDFEMYFSSNIYLIYNVKQKHDLVHINYIEGKTICFADFNTEAIENIIQQHEKETFSVFVHGLTNISAYLALEIKKRTSSKLYWACWGADLYGRLLTEKKYDLFDDAKFFNKYYTRLGYLFKDIKLSLKVEKYMFNNHIQFFKELDYFCTWNYLDFDLFQKYYKSDAVNIDYRYSTINEQFFLEKRQVVKDKIIINHSASKFGNHLTILKKLLKIGNFGEKLIIPLSYGPLSEKNKIVKFLKNSLLNYTLLESFMSKDEYFEILSSVKVAIFGHKRQEAANNVYMLLMTGAKVYLRKGNNLLDYFKDKGYFIYDFDDISSLNDFQELPLELQEHNKKLVWEEFNEQSKDKMYKQISKTV